MGGNTDKLSNAEVFNGILYDFIHLTPPPQLLLPQLSVKSFLPYKCKCILK